MHEAHFKLLSLLLPSYQTWDTLSSSTLDMLTMILSHSPLMNKAADILSRESVEEMTQRFHMCRGVLDFILALESHAGIATLAYVDRKIYHQGGGSLLALSFDNNETEPRLDVKDTGKSFVTLLESLSVQARAVLKLASATGHDFAEGDDLLFLSKLITQISDHHNQNKEAYQGRPADPSGIDNLPKVDLQKWHSENCLLDVADETILSDHAFAKDATAASSSMPPRGRMKRLVTEVSNLQTSLPEGIFIRHGASRLDLMKILIIGPRGTPYEHGFFEFDLLCPLEYPSIPPRLKFRTTGGGRIRFNPNLYENGKVCLSLLGTWSGEPWRPEQSTILQVLVSIQAMILCEQPWYNEPGRENAANKALSTRYNHDVRSWTLQHAILPWAAAIRPGDTKQAPGLHLRHNATEILRAYKQAASKSKNVGTLAAAVQLVSEALKNTGYLG
ncbi:UBC-like protein [Xylariaceae sp. FL1651]|nr:UBC-like protein [Xylariaceae sp. FL1651]